MPTHKESCFCLEEDFTVEKQTNECSLVNKLLTCNALIQADLLRTGYALTENTTSRPNKNGKSWTRGFRDKIFAIFKLKAELWGEGESEDWNDFRTPSAAILTNEGKCILCWGEERFKDNEGPQALPPSTPVPECAGCLDEEASEKRSHLRGNCTRCRSANSSQGKFLRPPSARGAWRCCISLHVLLHPLVFKERRFVPSGEVRERRASTMPKQDKDNRHATICNLMWQRVGKRQTGHTKKTNK